MRRLPVKVIRYSATPADANNLLEQVSSNPEHGKPGAALRLIAADALNDLGRHEEENLLRGDGRVFVANGTVKPMPHHVEIRGRRWFQRAYGNTYHTAHVYIDGKHVLSVPRQYGYGEQYADTAMDMLEKQGLIPPREKYGNGGHEARWQWRDRHGIGLDVSAEDVRRQRDLDAPPPPSNYTPPSSPQEKLSRKRLPVKVIKFSTHSPELAGLLKEARSNPEDTTLHGAIADKLEEMMPDSPLHDLIRQQYGLGQYGGQGEKESTGEFGPFYNSWDGTFPFHARLGQHGPFNLYLTHEGEAAPHDGEWYHTGWEHASNGMDEGDYPGHIHDLAEFRRGMHEYHNGRAENPQKWVVRAVSRMKGSNDSGYNFEFPHEEAHKIPQMFPKAKKYINPSNWTAHRSTAGKAAGFRQEESRRFGVQMQQEENARG
jgi:hypothetical protein